MYRSPVVKQVWKQLCGQRLELEDLRLVDLGLVQSLERTLVRTES
jgi:hypothetical protein